MNASKKQILAWAMYDWANSAFATTVMAGFFPLFFKEFWNKGIDPSVSTARLGIANSIAGIVVALSAPLLGAIADRGLARKKFLSSFAVLGIAMTSLLYFIPNDSWLIAAIFYVLASIGFAGGNVFYDSLITTVAPKDKLDSVSSLGFALGYMGGGLLLALNVWAILKPEQFGFENSIHAIRFSFVSVAVWWAVFSVPILLFVKEQKYAVKRSCIEMIKAGSLQLKETLRDTQRLKPIFFFLAAYWLYIDGVDTIVCMAIDYGMSIGFKSVDLISALLITQFVGFPSAIGFGYLSRAIGTARSILLALAVYLFILCWGAIMQTKQEFYALAAMIGLVQGGIQALSRSYYARIIPQDKSAEFFGFYNMIGKFAAVIGPSMMAVVVLVVRWLGAGGNTASRISIASLSLFFIAGGILFYLADKARVNAHE
ncbi:MAG: MFS transporter [Pseudomonadota bacterium]